MKSEPGLLSWITGSDKVDDRYVLMAIPPGFVGIVSHDSFGWLNVRPTNVQSSLIQAGAMSSYSGKDSKGNIEFTQAFFAEDKVICERVQSGMSSRHVTGGSLVELEEVLVNFYQFLNSRLFKR
jgi:choline monooxygenase